MNFLSTIALLLALTFGTTATSTPVQHFWLDEPANAQHEISGEIDVDILQTLDNTSSGWGQGTRTDEYNRPLSAIAAQDKYGKYDALYIGQQNDTIYLTIDEGYENGYTTQILDVLKEKSCPAVFFVTMDYVKKNPELIQRMINEGHVIGNHSVTHPSAGLPSQSLSEQTEELMVLHRYMEENYGYSMYLFRYPAGIHSEQSLALVQQLGYQSVFWSFAYRDWVTDDQPEPAVSLEKIVDRLHPGAIYLLHAVSATNTQILGDFIDQTRAAGYTFSILS